VTVAALLCCCNGETIEGGCSSGSFIGVRVWVHAEQ
jgi:hypothetical protein